MSPSLGHNELIEYIDMKFFIANLTKMVEAMPF